MPPDYRFVPVARTDYPMLRRWLAAPHMDGWWGTPEAEIALIEAEIDTGPADMRIVHADRPFAFVQDWPVETAPQFADAPHGARAIDTFLGEPGYLGLGHAALYLRQRATALLAGGAPAVLTDPDPANGRAVATYRRAGFRDVAIRPCEDGDPVLVLRYDPVAPAP